ncbi:hypothetical protein B0I37DRAFT_295430, partial [Chaetomium sp. MPI-CAGE-AT-0009]
TSYRVPGSSDPMESKTDTSSTRRPVVPTAETQDLYNKWRKAHDETLNRESLRQMQNLHSGHLQPPSPSQATMSSRSPSNASTTYSVSHAMDEMNVGDQPRPRQRSGRRGPLSHVQQLRANLMRKIGACAECRARRVSCKNHHVLTLFEEAYEASKQETRAQETRAPVNATPHAEATAPYGTRLGNPADLAGVGSGQSHLADPPHHFPDGPAGGMDAGFIMDDDFTTDFPDFLQNPEPTPPPHLASILSSFPDSQVPVSNPAAQHPPPVQHPPVLSQGHGDVMIAKQVAPRTGIWICLGENGGFGSCGWQFDSLPALEEHFLVGHRAGFCGRKYTWGCANCQFQVCEIGSDDFCIRCRQQTGWVMWYWGQVKVRSGPPSAVPGLTTSRGSGPS